MFCIALIAVLSAGTARSEQPTIVQCELDTGYRGIWYANQPSNDEYKWKYSGGLATYPQQHHPLACYDRASHRTYFVYGGMREDGHTARAGRSLLIMVSYYDHATGTVPRPRRIMDKRTDDAHDNPTIQIDAKGHIWVVVPAHGTSRPSYIYRSIRPRDIDGFELVLETNFSYPQPWFLGESDFLLLHTRYKAGRQLFAMRSTDGRDWSEPELLARVEQGHYQISWPHGHSIGTAFNFHPREGGLNARTNLYYMQSDDVGRTWRNIRGEPLTLPLTSPKNPALVYDYQSEGHVVYLKDLNYDAQGRPIILYLTGTTWKSGPSGGLRTWHTAHWDGSTWRIRDLFTSDHNYDTGCLHVEKNGEWRIFAPTLPGPQDWNSGGEVVLWISPDEGATWTSRPLTSGSSYNHTYMRRPVSAHPDFYAYWADGHAREPSPVSLYFATRDGRVFRLPREMSADTARPELVPLTTTRPE